LSEPGARRMEERVRESTVHRDRKTLNFPTHMPWLVKQEPSAYSWDDFVSDGRTAWTGVRNYSARLNLRAMKVGDRALFYHSVVGKSVMGVAKVIKTAYPDPTAEDGDWSAVDLAPEKALPRPISMDEIKTIPALKEMVLIKNSRLSVQPVTEAEFAAILKLAAKKK
jgi:predicted RNA-binding protein with PUA-like domain